MTDFRTDYRRLSYAFVAVMAFYCGGSKAGGTMVHVSVTVNSVPCDVNGGNPVAVDFGNDLLTTEVDGSHYTKNIDYTLDCTDAPENLKMTISGAGASFDGTVLQADQPDLGIKLLSNGKPLPLNTALNFTNGASPVLQAVPVMKPSGKLKAGAFTASATMTVDYQ